MRKQTLLLEELCKTSDLEKIQVYINKIMSIRGFNSQSPQDKMLLLVEEVGELAKALRKVEAGLPIDYNRICNYDTVESEIADIFIVLLSLCDVLGIDLFNAFIEKERENGTRKWAH